MKRNEIREAQKKPALNKMKKHFSFAFNKTGHID